MRVELVWIEKTEQYLMGTLPTSDRLDFESRLAQDANLRSHVDFQQQLIRGIRYLAIKNAAVKGYAIYKFRRMMILLSVSLVVISAVLLSVYYWPETEAGVPTNQVPDVEGSSEVISPEIETEQNDGILSDSTFVSNPDESDQVRIVSEAHQGNQTAVTENVVQKEEISTSAIPVSVSNQVPSEIAREDSLVKEHLWVITWQTSKEELQKIGEEIRAAGGDFRVKDLKYRGDVLVRIAFTVSNKDGEVSYSSPELDERGKVCIRFPEKGISAGWCGEGDEINFNSGDGNIPPIRSEAASEFANASVELEGNSVALMRGSQQPRQPVWTHYFKFLHGSSKTNRIQKTIESMDTL